MSDNIFDKLKTNIGVMLDQVGAFRDAVNADWMNGKDAWDEKDYGRALHNFVMGPIGEFFQHMWRWVMYGTIIHVAWELQPWL